MLTTKRSEDNDKTPQSSNRYSKATKPVAQSNIAAKQLALAKNEPVGIELILVEKS
jgi:hypothetical protein